jgi:hypothetical protein
MIRAKDVAALAAILTGAWITLGPTAFAAPGPANNHPGPPPPPTPPPSSDFQLTGFTATATNVADQLDLTVTVTQTRPDGSDFTKGSQTEFHAFPTDIWVWLNGKTPLGPYEASLTTSPTPGITYSQSGSGSVAATAHYLLTLPVPQSHQSGTYTLEIYSSSTPGDSKTFRMGPSDDGSWSDDIVSGTAATTVPNVPYGQLPEVPWAAGIPLVGLAASAWMWRRRHPMPLAR